MELQVELRKQIAEEFNRELNKVIKIDVKQYSIIVDGKEIGMVCQANGLPINWLPIANGYQPEVLAELEKVVSAELIKLHGEASGVRPANAPIDQESVDEAIEIAAKMADRESSVEDPQDQSNL